MAAGCVDKMFGCDGAIVCIGLNSLPIVGGRTVAGTPTGNVGDTAMNEKKIKLINYLFAISIIFK